MVIRSTIKISLYFCIIMVMASCAKPIANFSYSPEDAKVPARIQFSNESKKAETYEWDFGDGKTSVEESPQHRYLSSGEYTIILKARKGEKETTQTKKLIIKPPESCMVEIETNYGTMTVLLSDATPQHRDNFIKLAEEGFYDGIIFHRVINGFMIQGGDPRSKEDNPGNALGSGGPGYQIPAEFVDSLVHVKGAIAAARTSDQVNPERKSSGSQFYIVQGKKVSERELSMIEAQKDFRYTSEQRAAYIEKGGTPFLDRDYTVFGHVISGFEVIDKIANVRTERGDRPAENIKMKVRVIQ